MNAFTVTVEQQPQRTVVSVAGELDLHTLPTLEEATFVIPLGGKTLHLELSGVSFMDSSGLGHLLWLRRRLLAEGGRLVVTDLQSQPTSLLHLTETYELLTSRDASTTSHSTRQTPARG
jgi:anti-anti-sigma factor